MFTDVKEMNHFRMKWKEMKWAIAKYRVLIAILLITTDNYSI